MNTYYNSRQLQYKSPFGAAETSSEVTFKIFAPWAKEAFLRTWLDDEGENIIELNRVGDYFVGKANTPDYGCLFWYYFILKDENSKTFYYSKIGNKSGGEGMIYDYQPESYQLTVYKKAPVPKWYKDAIVYQIFPDRFNKGKDTGELWLEKLRENLAKSDKCPVAVLQNDWYASPEYKKNDAGDITAWEFFGGNLKGIKEKLLYIKSLGASAIYLNPIFSASSNHRYDTANYMQIDCLLGNEEDFKDLVNEAEKLGINVILDGVFNHTGQDSIYFDKYGNYGGVGAYDNEASKYRDWFRFTDEEPGYDCWWGVADLPNLEESNPDYREYICGKDGVLKHWLKLGARGFRLDVADELPDYFIEEIRKSIKDESKENVLIGEVWEDASNKISYSEKRKYLFGDELDSTMNYPVRDMLISFALGEIPASDFAEGVMSLYENYPKENFYGALNLIGSHDRARILTVLGNNDYYIGVRRLKLLSALCYSIPGVPCIYYGDEAGLMGDVDPKNRAGYPWGRENIDILTHYRMLGLIYNEHRVLKDGDINFLSFGNEVVAFSRKNEDETVIVAANRSCYEEHEITIDIRRIGDFCDERNSGTGFANDSCDERNSGTGLANDERNLELSPAKNSDNENKTQDYEIALDLLESKNYKIEAGTLKVSLKPLQTYIFLLKKESKLSFDMPRSAGVICHISSVPGGKLGKASRDFVDFLCECGIKLWQILPINPLGMGDSPYHCKAAFAGNDLLIDENELPDLEGFEEFCSENSYWLEDYVNYKARVFWNEKCKDSSVSVDALFESGDNDLSEGVTEILNYKKEEKLKQYYFAKQWADLKKYANSKQVYIIGDLPIYMAGDGMDVKTYPKNFAISKDGEITFRAGVPGDYFNPEGQDWGNPLYDWDYMKSDGYSWWINRLKQCKDRFDYVRIDHFRSFAAYFAIPMDEKPNGGSWVKGAGKGFFEAVEEKVPGLKIIAEDLGELDTGVYNLMKETGFPGMNVYQFSKDEMLSMDDEEIKTRIFYTGTHDNSTLKKWCEDNDENPEEVIEALYATKGNWVIMQLQDMLNLGEDARMNYPGNPFGNWKWQAPSEIYGDIETKERFKKLSEKYNR